MAYTLEQLKEKHKNQPFKRVVSFEEAERKAEVAQAVSGNQFAQDEVVGELPGGIKVPKFVTKATDFLFGGGKLAQGAGQALAAPGVQKQLTEAEAGMSDTLLAITKQINKRKEEGADTTRLEKARETLMEDMGIARDAQEDFVKSLKTKGEVIGSATRLATSAVLPKIGGAVAGATGATAAIGVGSGAVRGALSGAITGAIGGAGYGAGYGMESGTGAMRGALTGAGTGAVGGALLGGVIGGVTGKINYNRSQQNILDIVTPKTKDLTPTQYQKLVEQGRVTPKTATQPSQYILSKAEQEAAIKNADLITRDPVKTALNINNKIADIDDQVGGYLQKNNGSFSGGELRNHILSSIDDVTDITVDQNTLIARKEKMVSNFIETLEKKDLHSLWKARKAFDQKIEKAFSGSPTLQNELKREFRNAVQDFISYRTDNTTYGSYMRDMSHLYRLRDNVLIGAKKERAYSALTLWAKENKLKASAIGTIGAGALGYLGYNVGRGANPAD